MSGPKRQYVKLSELGWALELDPARPTPGPKQPRGRMDRKHARRKSSPPMVATKECALCGRPFAPGRYLCADHVALALEAAAVYRIKHREPGPGRVWMTEPTTKETPSV